MSLSRRTCDDWNESHDCRLPADHPGDHVCVGCHDRWNRGPWDEEGNDPFFVAQRPDERCEERR